MFRAGIITASDQGAAGLREDVSGRVVQEILMKQGFEIVAYQVVEDDPDKIAGIMIDMSDQQNIELIITTGGTGFSQRDQTPEATKMVVEREAPGIAEAMRAYSMTITKRAMLSRGIAGIRGNTLIVNLPGSPKAVTESLDYIVGTLEHGLEILLGRTKECGRDLEE